MTSGGDHVVTPGAAGTLVRRRLRPDGDDLDVAREAALLAVVARVSPLPVPRVVEVDEAGQSMVVQRLPGEPLLHGLGDLTVEDTGRLGHRLGTLVAALGGVPREDVADLVPVEASPLEEHRDDAVRLTASLGGDLPRDVREAVLEALRPSPPAPPVRLRLSHNDLGAEHVLVDDAGEVTGVVDWSDASWGDPALDLGLVLRDLGETGLAAALEQLPDHLDEDVDLVARTRLFAVIRALEDVAFGLGTDQQVYVDNALGALRRLA